MYRCIRPVINKTERNAPFSGKLSVLTENLFQWLCQFSHAAGSHKMWEELMKATSSLSSTCISSRSLCSAVTWKDTHSRWYSYQVDESYPASFRL